MPNVASVLKEEIRRLARKEAKLQVTPLKKALAAERKTVAAHYAHMVVHGLLHLQGYDHENARDAAAMERRERALLARFGYADPYRQRQE